MKKINLIFLIINILGALLFTSCEKEIENPRRVENLNVTDIDFCVLEKKELPQQMVFERTNTNLYADMIIVMYQINLHDFHVYDSINNDTITLKFKTDYTADSTITTWMPKISVHLSFKLTGLVKDRMYFVKIMPVPEQKKLFSEVDFPFFTI